MEIKQRSICDELGQNFIDFSYETNSCRAFADARDGLKPGQRACLWEMYSKGYTSSKAHVKSAKIAGGVVGTWWPHGDTSIYDTFTRMSQDWINNIPEVSWHGNNGSQIVPDAAAASRYTEARLSKIVEDYMFNGIKKKNVNMILNYSEDEEWPEVLPAVFPRLLVNGCQGIGSTIANVWLPHSLSDVCNVLIKYIDSDILDYSNLYPDFPTKCQIINKNDIHSIYETGKGKVVLRARAEIKNNHIYFRELPYQVYVEPLIEKIKDLTIKGDLGGIDAVYNRSSKKGIEIDIECSSSVGSVLSKLYAKTDLQKTYNANQWALVGKTPKLLTLEDYCRIYVNHNIECIEREARFDMEKAMARLHIVEGLLKALEDIDNVIALIKKSESSIKAKENLITKYNFSELQAKAILDMKLAKLAHLEKIELEQEAAELSNKIEELDALINNESLKRVELKKRLNDIVVKFGDKRKTELVHIEVPKEDKEVAEVVPEDVVVIVSQTDDIKRIPKSSFKVQKRNGKGVKTESDVIATTISTNTIDTLLFFTDKGKMYRLVVDNVPAGTAASKGVKISSLVNLEPDEKVMATTSIGRGCAEKYIVFITKYGMVKKSLLEEYFKTKRTTGIVAIKLKNGDEILNVEFMNEEDLVLISKEGMAIHFETKSINAIGRATAGVKSIKLSDDDEVLCGIALKKDINTIGIFNENGTGFRCKIAEIPIQGRNGKGVKIGLKTVKIASAIGVGDDDTLLISGKPSSLCISAKDMPIIGRTSSGNAMIKNSTIKKVIKL